MNYWGLFVIVGLVIIAGLCSCSSQEEFAPYWRRGYRPWQIYPRYNYYWGYPRDWRFYNYRYNSPAWYWTSPEINYVLPPYM